MRAKDQHLVPQASERPDLSAFDWDAIARAALEFYTDDSPGPQTGNDALAGEPRRQAS
jgi:hypothetical protein